MTVVECGGKISPDAAKAIIPRLCSTWNVIPVFVLV